MCLEARVRAGHRREGASAECQRERGPSSLHPNVTKLLFVEKSAIGQALLAMEFVPIPSRSGEQNSMKNGYDENNGYGKER